MTVRPGFESRMPSLLRAAPYIDVEELREKMAKEALDVLVTRGVPDFNRNAILIREFSDGVTHVLPESYGLMDILYDLLREECPQPDKGLRVAHDLFVHYFFLSNYELGI